MSIKIQDKEIKQREIKRIDAYVIYLSLFNVCAIASATIYFSKKLGLFG